MVSDDESIHQSINLLLSTTPGERIHGYDYGCPIRRYAFDVIENDWKALSYWAM